MSDPRSNDGGVELLARLLERSERNPDRSRPASAVPDYDALRTAQQIARFHDLISAAERFGAIEVKRGRKDRGHLIERVRVRDPELLAKYLGRPTAASIAQRARDELLPIAFAGQPWVGEVLEEIAARWTRGEAAYRLTATPLEAAKEFFKLLASISRQEAKGLDARTFSLRTTNDSKAFDRHASRLATILGFHIGEPNAAPDKIWSRIGLERFSHPVHLRGPIKIESKGGVLVDGTARPFASVHPEMLFQIKIAQTPTAVLTVENFASFNRQVREIEDGSLVVYTGGFPSAGVIDLLSRVLESLATDTPFLHWGDIDAGGVRIFRYLEQNLPRAPQPHQMSRGLAEAFGRIADPDPSLGPIAKSESAVRELADWLAFGIDVRHLEQEALDPQSPIRGRSCDRTARTQPARIE